MKLCPILSNRARGLVCGNRNGKCTEKENEGIECPVRDGDDDGM